jgi:hypothetical protein
MSGALVAAAALAGSVGYGLSDYLGGYVTRRLPVTVVLGLGQAIGLGILLIVVGVGGHPLTAAAVGWGAAAGLCGAAGLALLYRALAAGPMSAVAPTAAVAGAAVPVAAALTDGGHLSVLAALGAAAALAALPLLTGGRGQNVRGGPGGVAMALAAGGLLGLFSVVVAQTPPSSGVWPLVFARTASLTVLLPLVLTVGRRQLTRDAQPPRGLPPTELLGGMRLACLAGLIESGADVAALVAVRGELLIAGPLLALYPATTVVCARLLRHEPIPTRRRVGLALAGLAVVALTMGSP